MTQHHVISADGSRIGFELRGTGPMLVAVHGATSDRSRWAGVMRPLLPHFTVVAMDRRGRGLSRDESSEPYDISREVDDVRAVINHVSQLQDGAPVFLLGHSYGGLCALGAASNNPQVAKLLAYEPAFAVPGHDVIGPVQLGELTELIEAGKLETALDYFFLKIIMVEPAMLSAMKFLPTWNRRLESVHTLVREGAAANAWRPSCINGLTMPVRFFVGGVSPPWLRAATYAAHESTPDSSIVELEGQAHGAMDTGPALFVNELLRFWNDEATEGTMMVNAA